MLMLARAFARVSINTMNVSSGAAIPFFACYYCQQIYDITSGTITIFTITIAFAIVIIATIIHIIAPILVAVTLTAIARVICSNIMILPFGITNI